MKKIKTLVETAVLMGILPLLVFAEINHPRYSLLQNEKAPEIKRDYTINESRPSDNRDTINTGSPGSRIIVINL